MTEYVAIPDSDLEVDDGIKSEHALAWNNNLIAALELDATVDAAGLVFPGLWYPVSTLYDYDTDGAQSEVTYSGFEVGYDYRFICENVTFNTAGASETFTARFYKGTSASWTDFINLINWTNGNPVEVFNYRLDVEQPMRSAEIHYFTGGASTTTTTSDSGGAAKLFHVDASPAQQLTSVQLRWASDSFASGTVKLQRKKVQVY